MLLKMAQVVVATDFQWRYGRRPMGFDWSGPAQKILSSFSRENRHDSPQPVKVARKVFFIIYFQEKNLNFIA